ncbi:DUF1211 domain-containing protein [Agromyces protaetiae]|uniref:DUF1211 domain-containing protein n=1 Tax=Agromyces protaetiae TaxID=2509455 RepID=A0A4P6FB89_9MICO|nr:TMEM175 family protein [Agromyces protaetiae]QAY72866.1 DUF1211 domain-containing protein [Agromyces protaetiae]
MAGRRTGRIPGRTTVSTTRVEFFTDGVFAIAATLLVLELTTHAIGEVSSSGALWSALVGMTDQFISFTVSFLLLCLLWYRHVQQFEAIARLDLGSVWLNSLRLLFVVLIPFTTSINSEYTGIWLGRMLLPLNYFFALLFSLLFWVVASRPAAGLLKADVTTDEVQRATVTAAYRLGIGAVAVVLSPWIGSWAFLGFAFDPVIARFVFGARTRHPDVSKRPDDPKYPDASDGAPSPPEA